MTPVDATISRKEFLRTCARYGVLGLLATGAVRLVRRSGSSGRNRETCMSGGICRGCPVLNDCGLPAALSAKAGGVKPGEA